MSEKKRPGRPRTHTTDTTRICSKCSEIKLLEEFSSFRASYCRVCMVTYNRERYLKCVNPNARKFQPRGIMTKTELMRLRTYGVTPTEFLDLVDKNENVCPGCKRTPEQFKNKWVVDHDHNTNQIRGVICSTCNTALGMVRDDICTLLNLSEYLNLHYNKL